MRKYPHKPDMEWIRECNVEYNLSTYKKDVLKESEFLEEKNETFFEVQWECARDIAACSYAFEEPIENVLMYLREACRNLSISIELGLVMDSLDFFNYLSLALVVRDNKLVKQLSGFDRQRYTDPESKCSEASYLLSEIYANLAVGRHVSAAERVPKVISALSSALSSRSINRSLKRYLETKVMVAKAIIDRNQEEFDNAMETLCNDFIKRWSSPDWREFPEALFDINGLGLIRIAMDNGLVCNIQSVYLPLELLKED